jgi:haloalkane dehalogenase
MNIPAGCGVQFNTPWSQAMKPFSIPLVVIGLALANPTLGQADLFPAKKLPEPAVLETLSLPYKSVGVLGATMTYLEAGSGEPVVFVHGNPTSAYLWRNVIPYVAADHRAIAVDLIGMGGSDKPSIAYTFDDQYRYFAAFISALGLQSVTLVGHDWGATLAWEFARRHPNQVKRLAFMEGLLPPAFPQPGFDTMDEKLGAMFRAFKDEAQGRQMVIEDNIFIEQILPMMANRRLGNESMSVYRKPFEEKTARRPLLAWPREVPIAGTPQTTVETLNAIGDFMNATKMPVLLLYASPGVLVPPAAVAWYTKQIRNIESAFVGQGLHFIQEDQPDAIGLALAEWLRRH